MRSGERGITLIETMLAGTVLTICSLGMIGLITASIATNSRNRFDSTTTMLAESVVEQINSTLIGSGTASLTDCAGNTWNIDTTTGGATLNGSAIDFTQANPPTNYYLNYVVASPCTASGTVLGTYDVRWHIDLIGGTTSPTNSYLLTVGARQQNEGQGNLYFAAPVTLRVMSGN